MHLVSLVRGFDFDYYEFACVVCLTCWGQTELCYFILALTSFKSTLAMEVCYHRGGFAQVGYFVLVSQCLLECQINRQLVVLLSMLDHKI